ncbi:MAG: SBBP repeat-containing protein, partial [Bdellovibrionota bacterium]
MFRARVCLYPFCVLVIGIMLAGCFRALNRQYSSSHSWGWNTQLGQSTKTTQVSETAGGASGSIYVSGYTTGNLVSCGGVSANCAGNAQGTQDYYFSKYSSSGTWTQTIQLGQTGTTTGHSDVAVDGAENIYIAGRTTGNLPSCNGVSGACAGAFRAGTWRGGAG